MTKTQILDRFGLSGLETRRRLALRRRCVRCGLPLDYEQGRVVVGHVFFSNSNFFQENLELCRPCAKHFEYPWNPNKEEKTRELARRTNSFFRKLAKGCPGFEILEHSFVDVFFNERRGMAMFPAQYFAAVAQCFNGHELFSNLAEDAMKRAAVAREISFFFVKFPICE